MQLGLVLRMGRKGLVELSGGTENKVCGLVICFDESNRNMDCFLVFS